VANSSGTWTTRRKFCEEGFLLLL